MMENEKLSNAQRALNLVREWMLEPMSPVRFLNLQQRIIEEFEQVHTMAYDEGWVDADRAHLDGEMDDYESDIDGSGSDAVVEDGAGSAVGAG